MGLDMYIHDQYGNEVAYWRKFNALHGWMESLYREQGGTGTFNCVSLQLTPADLDNLEADLSEGLTPVEGFFFGEQTVYPEDVEATKEFIANAREAMESGRDVYYDSWW